MSTFRLSAGAHEGFDLTTVAACKALVGIKPDTTGDDAWFASRVSSVSRSALAILQRHVLSTERTEEYEIGRSRHVLSLDGYEIDDDAPFELWLSASRSYEDTPLDASKYVVQPRTGTARLLVELGAFKSYAKVRYTGGMAEDTAAFLVAYPDIAEAVAHQVAYLRSRRDALGGSLEISEGVKVKQQGEYGWLAESRRTLMRYRRVAA